MKKAEVAEKMEKNLKILEEEEKNSDLSPTLEERKKLIEAENLKYL